MWDGKGKKSRRDGAAEGLSGVRAIFVSDLHLQHTAPPARAGEADWYAAMRRPLDQISELVEATGAPVLYAGDIFDRWNAGPEVISFALKHLPYGYAVPGQHDLPNHDYNAMGRSAYGVLAECGHIHDVRPGERVIAGKLVITGFPWGHDLRPLDDNLNANPRTPVCIPPVVMPHSEVALVHKYIWIKGCGYHDAPIESKLNASSLRGYDVAVFGDNHIGFVVKPKGATDPWVINCGGLMRRRSDEAGHYPAVGLLFDDGHVERHELDTSGESFTGSVGVEQPGITVDVSAFVDAVAGLGGADALDFAVAMRQFMDTNKTPARVRAVLEAALEGALEHGN